VAHAGQEFEAGTYRLRLIQTGAETGGELLEMEAEYGPDSAMPPEHLHPSQAERFEVLEGAMLTVIDGVEQRYEAGAVFEVPAGTAHQMRGDGRARVSWRVTPALRTAEFFEGLYGGAAATDFAGFLDEFSDEIRFEN
jgi:quercetin dioxygenase-like cupin family protein